MPLYVGTSGWQYRHWKDRFYPSGMAQGAWLEHYAERFQTVEVNNAFYRLPDPGTFAAWAQRTPADFVVGVKASRYLTHIKRLREPQEPAERFLSHAAHLGAKLGPVLLQLPPTLKCDVSLLEETLDCFGRRARIAVEFRHDSWYTERVRSILAGHDAALCLADRDSSAITPLWRTAGWGYVRWHSGRAALAPCYGRTAMTSWAERIAGLWSAEEDVFAYFNNDPQGCALRDAGVFARAAKKAGLHPTRVPARREVRVG
ncbi:MAG: DUF72 domain-containing protein [Actinomycetota bacterium]|nr:DUF72 domain-containing protein [Actinomycetota bacterium]